MYKIIFGEGWNNYFSKLDKSVQVKIIKKIEKMRSKPSGRHHKYGFGTNVEEIGQYRIVYVTDEKEKIRIIYFVGTHKDYEKWLGLRR